MWTLSIIVLILCVPFSAQTKEMGDSGVYIVHHSVDTLEMRYSGVYIIHHSVDTLCSMFGHKERMR